MPTNTHDVSLTADGDVALALVDTDGEDWQLTLTAVAATELADRIAEALA